tara:strand:- start:151 stop:792 length:642 start_codon:yes stop_codon:yes gene_type:complete
MPTTYTVAANGDDGYATGRSSPYGSSPASYIGIASSGNDVLVGNTDMDMDDYTTDYYLAWFRFNSIAAAQAATINSAYLKLAHSSETSTGTWKIGALAHDNASAPSSSSDMSISNWTSARVDASNINSGMSSGDIWTSADIKTVVQEVVNRSGWSSGNSIVITLGVTSGTSAKRSRKKTYEGSAPAQLVLDVAGGGGSSAKIPVTLFINGMST